jgi:hypothetical protein
MRLVIALAILAAACSSSPDDPDDTLGDDESSGAAGTDDESGEDGSSSDGNTGNEESSSTGEEVPDEPHVLVLAGMQPGGGTVHLCEANPAITTMRLVAIDDEGNEVAGPDYRCPEDDLGPLTAYVFEAGEYAFEMRAQKDPELTPPGQTLELYACASWNVQIGDDQIEAGESIVVDPAPWREDDRCPGVVE